jgi:Tfp pilus assembly major pilin PilA
LVRATLDRIVGRSYGLVEFMIVTGIIALLAAGAGPVYESYVRSARTVEAKMIASSLWTALRSHAMTTCGNTVTVSTAYTRAGLDVTGATNSARWLVSHGHVNTVMMHCSTGAFTPDGDIFTISGGAKDVEAIRVKLVHVASGTPPSRLLCSTDSGTSFIDC